MGGGDTSVDQIKAYWDRHPQGTQFVNCPEITVGSGEFFDHIRPHMDCYRFPYIMARIERESQRLRGKHLLEIGCGLGFDAIEFMKRGVRVTATDLTPANVDLAAFGPATVMDMQAWCGLTRRREIFERLRPELRIDRNQAGRELFDLPDAPRPDPDTPAPPRFLPSYDNVTLGHADRTRIVSDELRREIMASAGMRPTSTFLVDGTGAGTWSIGRDGENATLTIQPARRLTKRDRSALTEEAARMLEFSAEGATTCDVRIV